VGNAASNINGGWRLAGGLCGWAAQRLGSMRLCVAAYFFNRYSKMKMSMWRNQLYWPRLSVY